MQIRLIQGWLPWLMGLPQIVSLNNYSVVVRPTELDSDWTASTKTRSEDEDRHGRESASPPASRVRPRAEASSAFPDRVICLPALVNDTTVAITHLNTWPKCKVTQIWNHQHHTGAETEARLREHCIRGPVGRRDICSSLHVLACFLPPLILVSCRRPVRLRPFWIRGFLST